MVEEYLEKDGRFHCPHCNWSTVLPNKFARHLEKKHGPMQSDLGDSGEPVGSGSTRGGSVEGGSTRAVDEAVAAVAGPLPATGEEEE